ncbi:MAG: hypothetical protein RR128_08465, partial [Clostridium sp.]
KIFGGKCMFIRELFYLKINFDGYTKECEEVIIGICEEMDIMVNELASNRSYVIASEYEHKINYVKYLAECDMVKIIG